MKAAVIAGITSILLLGLVIANGIYVHSRLDIIENKIENAPLDESNWGQTKDAYEAILDNFLRQGYFLSLTVGDKDLLDIEGCLGDVISAAENESKEEFRIAKSRLICYIKQLRQLCGFNIKSIF